MKIWYDMMQNACICTSSLILLFLFHIFVAHSRDLFQSQISHIHASTRMATFEIFFPLSIPDRGAQSPPTHISHIMQYAWFSISSQHNTLRLPYQFIPLQVVFISQHIFIHSILYNQHSHFHQSCHFIWHSQVMRTPVVIVTKEALNVIVELIITYLMASTPSK